MQKKSFNSSGKRQLQVFSRMMQMKFKPRSNAATTAIVQKNKKMISKSQKNITQLDLSRSTMSRMINNDKKLKYLSSLSPEYFLIGNENQIDMIGILGIAHNFVDTDYCWSLGLEGPIDCLAVEPRKCLIAIVSEKKLYFYKYNIKKCKQQPQLIKDFQIKSNVKFIQFPKDSLFGLFYERQFEIYNVQEQRKIYKKCSKSYNEPENLKLFAVPQVVQNSLKVFFIEDQEGSKTFGLWFIKINIELSTIEIEKPQKVYDIKRNLRKMLVVENFSKDIIFMNIGAQILAAKNGYILDSANVNIQSGNAKLKYVSNQRLIHISDKKLQVYKMHLLTNVVPNKIQVSPIDALEITDKPHEAQFFGIVNTIGDNFGIFYQNMSQFNIFKKGEASYWFALTQSISLDEKIRRLFHYGSQISTLNPELLQEKCDMARKMGLNEKQLYLQIWNRSNKNSIKDYQFILATRNYKTIHTQIEKKLKKESMSFRELLKIEQSCMIILRQAVYGQKCTEENIQQFLASHCFIKKLKLFKDIELFRKQIKKSTIKYDHFEEEGNKLLINIQQYYQYKEFDIKNYLVEKIADFCLYDKPHKQMQIRMMLKSFKFVFRVIYKEILEEIIKLCKGKLVILLKAIPEILPYANNKTQSQLQPNQQPALYDGIWGDIKPYQWQRNLFVENLTTIDNKQTVVEFTKSIWYKRYWLTAHQLVNLNKENIVLLNKENNSEFIFYFFISKVFEIIHDENTQFQVIYFLEENYMLIPQHLQGKIFLYFNLHKFYKANHHKAKLPAMKLDEFLNLNDAQLFQYFFTQEKHTKNCILKSIKRIYQETCQDTEGLHLFNQGLLAYFKSDLSQISDLKYLLNRMNNEKTQFHQANLSIYSVLVRAMEYKLKIGSHEDIPIDEVLIYIENIPISRDEQVIEQLYIVKRINQESERFRKMKINMTIKEIIDNFEEVISRVVQYEFQLHQIRKIRSEKHLTQITYKVLAQIQVVQEKIYGMERNPALPFFIYLAKLLEEIQQIKLAKLLLANEFINNYFPVDEMMIENLVLYMYKWTFSKDHTFLANEEYIKELLTLLPEDNEHRRFIENETAFAIALSSEKQPLEYPVSLDTQYPGIFQLGQILRGLNIDHVIKVDIDFIYKSMRAMQDISLASLQKSQSEIGISTIEKITEHEVYSAFIIKMIDDNHLNDAIRAMKRLLKLPVANKRYNMVYFALLIQKLSSQLNDESKNIMVRMISFCFDEPEKLFQLIEYYLNSKEIALAKSKTLKGMMQQYIKGRVNFNKDNFLFNSQSRLAFANPQMQQNSTKLFYEKCLRLKRTKQDFRNIEYDILFSMITNEPYVAAKFIQANQDHINFKTMRNYLSYVIQQHLFDQMTFIEFCKRVFAMVLESNIKRKDISRIILNEERFHFHYGQIRSFGIEDEIDKRIEKTYKNFEKKKKSLLNFVSKKSSSIDRESESIHQIHIQLLNPDQVSSQNPSQYPFSDSDNDMNNQQPVAKKKSFKKKRRASRNKEFNIADQRNKIMRRKDSFFGDKSSQTNRSRNSEAYDFESSQDDQFSPSKMSLSLKVPEVKRSGKIYMKRSRTKQMEDGALNKISLVIQERQQSSSSPSKLKNIEKRQSYSFGQSPNEEQANNARQQSQYAINEIAQLQQQDPVFRIKNIILKNFDIIKDKIDFEVLVKQQSTQEFSQNLKQVLVKIYEDRQIQNKNKLKLIRLICQKYPKIILNQVFLSVYENIQKLEEKYALGLPIDRLLPFNGLLIQSKALDDLFKIVMPHIIEIATDETIFKLSKLISFGFRKNIYEAEISFQYIKKMIDEFTEDQSQVQLNMRLEIIKSLLSKMSILSLKEKAPKLIQGIFANPTLIRKIIDLTFESVKKRGDAISATQIKKSMQKSIDK